MRRGRGTGMLVVALAGIAIAGPHLVGSATQHDITHGLDALGGPLPPSPDAWLGTDWLGRDVLARVVEGAASSLGIALVATLLALVTGTCVGLVAGYAGGRVDAALMRLVDLVLAVPALLLAILLATLLRERGGGGSSAPVVTTLAIVGWPSIARLVRHKARVLATSELGVAARSLGASGARIVAHHLLPNVAGLVLALAALAFAQNLLAEAVLSYVGLGPPPPAPTWGRMLFEGRVFYRTAPHLVVVPAVAIVVAVLACQLVAARLQVYAERPR